MLNSLRQFDYLLKMIRENQKKTMVEWIGLIRTALLEVDDAIGRNVIVMERTEAFTFQEFQKYMERIAVDLGMAKRVFPVAEAPPKTAK